MAEEIEEVDDAGYMDLSDEEFAKLPEPTEDNVVPDKDDVEVEGAPEAEEDIPEKEDDPEDDEDAPETAKEEEQVESEGEDPKGSETEKETPSDDPVDIDYEAEYKKLMAPFKANGREMTLKNVEDAKRLQEMGANYHKKMAGMKPALKALKTLENNGLLDDGKLDYLIELYQGKPEAVTQLLKDSKIDPLDVDVTTETPYTPADHSATEEQLNLDSVLNDIKESPNYNKTLDTVTEKWDKTSLKQVIDNPNILSVINGHMDNGVYDQVMNAVEYDRSVGRLDKMSDLEAYKVTGNRLEQEGAFKAATSPKAVAPLEPDPVKELKRKARKKAASPTKTTSKVGKLSADFNPLDLSDEEFAKFDKKRLGL